jgi:signal transduction histidine kinase
MLKIILTTFFFIYVFFFLAQSDEIITLEKTLLSNSPDSVKLQTLSDLNWIYSTSDFEKSKTFAERELNLAKKIKDSKWIAQAYNDLAISYYKLGDFDSSLIMNYHALDIREKLKDDLLIASSLSKIGTIYQETGKYKKAIEIQFKVLKISEKAQKKTNIGITKNNIAVIYHQLKNTDKSIHFSKSAITEFDPETEDYYIAQSHGNLGSSYSVLKKHQTSNYYLQLALKVFKKYGDKVNEAGVENGIGLNFRSQNKIDEALLHYQKAYDLSSEINDKTGKNLYAHNISIVLKKLGRFQEAEKYLLETLTNTEESNSAQRLMLYRQLATLYGYLKDGDKVEFYLDKYSSLKETIFNQNNAKEIANFETKYNTEKTKRLLVENQAKLEAQQKRLIFSISMFAFITLLFILIYRFQKDKRKKLELGKKLEKILLEKDFGDEKLRIARELHDNIGSQLTFIISSLDNLEYLPNQAEKLSKISDLSNFGRLTMKDLRDTIWAMNHDGGTFEQLITRVSELRSVLPSTLSVSILSDVSFNKALNGLQLLNIYRIAQEFIQNTIKYANASEVKIEFSNRNSNFLIEICDNGEGFDLDQLSFGNGILNIKRRCEDLNGQFEINSSTDGTKIQLSIPH